MDFSLDGGALEVFREFDATQDLLDVHCRGRATLAALIEFSDRVYMAPGVSGTSGVLVDLGEVEFKDLTAADVRALVEHEVDPPLPAGLVVALVLPEDLGFGLGRMFHMLADDGRPATSHVCRTRAEALAILRARVR